MVQIGIFFSNIRNRSLFLSKTKYSMIFVIPTNYVSKLEVENVENDNKAFQMFNSNNKLQKIDQSLIVETDSMFLNIKGENLIVETDSMLLNIPLLKNLRNRSLLLL
jgi:hypothetical protein